MPSVPFENKKIRRNIYIPRQSIQFPVCFSIFILTRNNVRQQQHFVLFFCTVLRCCYTCDHFRKKNQVVWNTGYFLSVKIRKNICILWRWRNYSKFNMINKMALQVKNLIEPINPTQLQIYIRNNPKRRKNENQTEQNIQFAHTLHITHFMSFNLFALFVYRKL